MPYNPGVQNMAGQFIAQGMSQMGEGLAAGIKQYQQNKLMAAQGVAKFEGAVGANPEIIQFLSGPNAPKEAASAFKKLSSQGSVGVKDAASLAMFVDSYNNERQSVQLAKAREQEIKAREAAANALKADSDAFKSAFNEGFQDPNDFLRKYSSKGGSIGGLKSMGFDVDKLLFPQAAGESPTAAMKDAQATLRAEIDAGLIKSPEQAKIRYATLMAQGGKDYPDRYDNAGTFMDESGNAIVAVKSKETGIIGQVGEDGKLKPLDLKKYRPTTPGDVQGFLSPEKFDELRKSVVEQEIAIRALLRYAKGREGLPKGIQVAVSRVTAAFKTLFDSSPLTKEEMEIGLSESRKQGLLGKLRTTVVGPGVMTEQDAQRVIDRLGGDVSAFTNPEVVQRVITEVLQESIAKYEADVDVYNTHVARKYGISGYRQRERIQIPGYDLMTKSTQELEAEAAALRNQKP